MSHIVSRERTSSLPACNHCQLFLTTTKCTNIAEACSFPTKYIKQVEVHKRNRINKIRKTGNWAEEMHSVHVNDKWTNISELNASPIIILKYTYSFIIRHGQQWDKDGSWNQWRNISIAGITSPQLHTAKYVRFVISFKWLNEHHQSNDAFRCKYNLTWLHNKAMDLINKRTPC